MEIDSGPTPGPGKSGEQPRDVPRLEGRFTGDRLLVPLFLSEIPAVVDQLRVAETLVRATDASLHLLVPIALPDQTPNELPDEVRADEDRAVLEWAFDRVDLPPAQVNGAFLYARDIILGILRTVRTSDIDTLVVPSRTGKSRLRSDVPGQLAVHADCDVITVNGRRGYESMPSILLPVAGGPHSGIATDVARQIAAECEAWVDVLHVVPETARARQRRRGRGYLETAQQRLARPEKTTTRLLEADDVADAIVEQSAYYELTVIGAPTTGRLRRLIFGSTNRSIRGSARSVLLSARANQ